jgi:hypothetical protein
MRVSSARPVKHTAHAAASRGASSSAAEIIVAKAAFIPITNTP